MSPSREREVTESFVSLADSLVDGFDVVDLLIGLTQSCAQLLDIASAGLLLADQRRVLHVIAASSEATRDLELFQLQRDQGPCLDCYRTGTPVSVPDLSEQADVWPSFAQTALSAGFVSVHAVPMRLRDDVLGTLGLFGSRVGSLNEDDLRLAQALAHVASVAIVQNQIAADASVVTGQLQLALSSRVVLEQAKGSISQRGDISMDTAFEVLRRYARDHNLRLTDVAAAVVARTLPAGALIEHTRSRAVRPPPSA